MKVVLVEALEATISELEKLLKQIPGRISVAFSLEKKNALEIVLISPAPTLRSLTGDQRLRIAYTTQKR